MRKLVLTLAIAALGVTAPSAFAGDVGQSASSNAHEARPLGQVIIKGSAQLRPCVLD